MSKKKIKVRILTAERDAALMSCATPQIIGELTFTTGLKEEHPPINVKVAYNPYPNVTFSPMIHALANLEELIRGQEQMISYKLHYHVLGYEDDTKPTDQ